MFILRGNGTYKMSHSAKPISYAAWQAVPYNCSIIVARHWQGGLNTGRHKYATSWHPHLKSNAIKFSIRALILEETLLKKGFFQPFSQNF